MEAKMFRVITTLTERLIATLSQQPYAYCDELRQRLYLAFGNRHMPYRYAGAYSRTLIALLVHDVRRVAFVGLAPISAYLEDVTGSWTRMAYRRGAMEVAKKLPSWRLKNKLYAHMGADISDAKTTIVAPNAFLDYIYPELIRIGARTFIGEEAMLTTHFAYPDRFEIGPITIGSGCLIGMRAVVAPGVAIGNDAVIGACAFVTRDVPSGARYLGQDRFDRIGSDAKEHVSRDRNDVAANVS